MGDTLSSKSKIIQENSFKEYEDNNEASVGDYTNQQIPTKKAVNNFTIKKISMNIDKSSKLFLGKNLKNNESSIGPSE